MLIANYIPLILLVLVAVAVVGGIIFAAEFFGPKNPTREKLMPYESGSDPLSEPQASRFSVKFYMVAISFILFDLETVFVIPWAMSWRESAAMGHGFYSFAVMALFLAILTIGLVYEWSQGGLEWD
ncbi:NADH-quinone oxidoreductase subunit A [Bradymonadaceae bacterium TMQ3]|uniref:NADH-quinone oxidoreductase subunit A n=1 Tax=Lujinxingia sediminis TaxID=2480984 RepID=A0ABY0CTJ8_9DELT|nr:NADH-quinone oxidoreductase subunit A [Lujinxingia sediminis]RDV38886.1 NADH-quinone oxidoreductase subunit A [Bradymonadaceae bacterium TMQ3]RVU44120.1 NADH-quinone oxidoreductase subunit A [Lujinxingia sediminis]TXC76342.1 NADH-quinone oxidoreductase subunit A [Bradymonadales bacterium TMQ1]